ncbi:helix-turn-helix domain-containing protein [Streptomyces sp. NPDC059762]|uniref:helix-turn-helix domain-containing protein n=1 Tax=Streptomyces sp. NPDC059762 TaxID=3346938 RepID=UPI00365943CF
MRELRQKRGLHQQDLASEDVSSSYVSLIESGKRVPSQAVLATLAAKLGVSPEYLLTGRSDTQAKELQLKIGFGDMALRNGANGEALQSFSEALAQSQFLDHALVRRARRGQAGALEKLGQIEAAIPILHELYDDPEVVVGSDEWAQLGVALCRCYRDVGDLALAVDIGEAALSRLNALGLDVTDDHIQLGATLMGCYHERGDLTKAQMLANRLLSVAEQAGARAGRGAVYWNSALVAESRGQTAEALALIERALALMAEGDNARHCAMLKQGYGYFLLAAPEPDPQRAKELLEQAREALLGAGSVGELADCEIDLARAQLRLGEVSEGGARAERALGLLGAEPTPEAVAARNTMAEAALLAGDTDRAAEILRTSGRQLGHLASSRRVAHLWQRTAELWQACGDAGEAVAAYRKALAKVGMPSLPLAAGAFTTPAPRRS